MRTQPHYTVFRELTDANRLRKLQFELTKNCNLNCIHCKVENRRPGASLSKEDVFRAAADAKELGTFEINLSGGEIFTHPDVREILDALLREDFLLTIQSNVTILDADIRALLRAGRKRVSVITASVYGMSAQTHEAVTRTPGSLARTLRNIEALRDDGHRVMVLSPQTRLNTHEFDAVRNYCAKNGFLFAFDALITPGDAGGFEPLSCRLDDAALLSLPGPKENLSYLERESRPGEFAPDRPITSWCTMGRGMGIVTATGDVWPCPRVNLIAGNIHEQSLTDIWLNSPVLRNIRDIRVADLECGACEHLPHCRPCPGVALLEHGDLFRTPAEICRITRAFLNKKELKAV